MVQKQNWIPLIIYAPEIFIETAGLKIETMSRPFKGLRILHSWPHWINHPFTEQGCNFRWPLPKNTNQVLHAASIYLLDFL